MGRGDDGSTGGPGEAGGERRRRRQRGRAGVRLADVARLAGVSSGSVSRALNTPELVSPCLRARVREAIDALGWVPNGAARALASLRSRTIGAIIPTLANANFAQEINVIQGRLLQNGYILLLACSDYDPDKALIQARAMVERGIDGMILVGEDYPDALWRLLEGQGLPYVVTYGLRRGSARPSVGCDNRRAFVRLTEMVLDLGHERIAVIAQRILNNDRAAARLEGILETLSARGIRLRPGHLVEREWSISEGRQGLREIMVVQPRPTAIICANDYLAAGAIVECQAMGIEVPGEVSIVGFDDLDIAAHLSPALTTMRVPMHVLGEATADYIVRRLGGDPDSGSVEVDAVPVVRESLGPPPKGLGSIVAELGPLLA